MVTSEIDWPHMIFSAGAGLGVLAGRHALRVEHPLVDVRALKVKTYAVVNSGGSMFRMSMSAPTFLLPLLFQIGLGRLPERHHLACQMQADLRAEISTSGLTSFRAYLSALERRFWKTCVNWAASPRTRPASGPSSRPPG